MHIKDCINNLLYEDGSVAHFAAAPMGCVTSTTQATEESKAQQEK